MDNKIGDFLLCKKDYINNSNILVFKINKCYQITRLIKLLNNTIIVEIYSSVLSPRLWYRNDDSSNVNLYVWTYFYTTAELREMQIDSILND